MNETPRSMVEPQDTRNLGAPWTGSAERLRQLGGFLLWKPNMSSESGATKSSLVSCCMPPLRRKIKRRLTVKRIDVKNFPPIALRLGLRNALAC